MMLAPPCFTVLCTKSVLLLEFRVWGSSAKYLWHLDPKRTILLSSLHKLFLHFSLGQSILANCQLFFGKLDSLQHFFFVNSGTLRGLLANRLASHKCLLIVTALKGNCRPSLISLELISKRAFWLLFNPFEKPSSVFFHVSLLWLSILTHWRSI